MSRDERTQMPQGDCSRLDGADRGAGLPEANCSARQRQIGWGEDPISGGKGWTGMKVLWAALVIAVFGCIAVPVALGPWTVLCIVAWASGEPVAARPALPVEREVVA
jgi:hypothetical protein